MFQKFQVLVLELALSYDGVSMVTRLPKFRIHLLCLITPPALFDPQPHKSSQFLSNA